MIAKVGEFSKKLFLSASFLFVSAFCLSVFANLFELTVFKIFISKPLFSMIMGIDITLLVISFIVWLLSLALIKFNLKDRSIYDSDKERKKLGILILIIWLIMLMLFIGMIDYAKTHTLLPILPKITFNLLFILFPIILMLLGNRIVKALAKGIVIFFTIILIASQTLFIPHKIKGPIMSPKISDNDYVFSRKYILDSPKRGDIVIYNLGTRDAVSRIVGLPGENILFQNDKIFINGEVLNEDYLAVNKERRFDLKGEAISINLKNDQFILIADNYSRGIQKENIIKVNIQKIKSKIWYRYWPSATKGFIE